MKKTTFTLALLLITLPAVASEFSFYMIYPEGEGDTEAARPYLARFFDYLKEKTGITVAGLYLNDEHEGAKALKNKDVNLAIVSPDFFDKYRARFHLEKILNTVPIYATGPYERYYIMAHKDTDIAALRDKEIRVNLFSSQNHTDRFLKEKIFTANDQIKQIPWQLRNTGDILGAIKKVAKGTKNTFVLLSGHEFAVVNKLKKRDADFAALKLVYTSRELPSSPLVTVGNQPEPKVAKIKKALVEMSANLKGNIILKKLRLKGFVE